MINNKVYYTVFLNCLVNAILLGAAPNSISISGVVIDIKNNLRVQGAIIYFAGLYTTSDENGYFKLDVKGDKEDSLIISSLGHEKYSTYVRFNKDTELIIYLIQEEIKTKQVTIFGQRYIEEVIPSEYYLQTGDLRKIPQLGELDALRSLHVFPSVSSTHDFSAQLYIRGGNFDENYISLDGVPIYNPYHLGGVTGVISTDLIRYEYLYPSNYTPDYGGYLSSVLSMNSKDGNSEKLRGNVSLGLISSSLSFNGPLFGGSFFVSGRRTYFDLLSALILSDDFPYNYYDIFAKYSIPADKNLLFKCYALITRDEYKIFTTSDYINNDVKINPNWGNLLFSIKAQYLFSAATNLDIQLWYSSTSLNSEAYSEYKYSPTQFIVDNNLHDITFKACFRTSVFYQSLFLGVELKTLENKYYWDINKSELDEFIDNVEYAFFDYAPKHFQDNNRTSTYSLYLLDSLNILKKIHMQLGGRLVYFNSLPKFDYFSYLNLTYKLYTNLEVRFSFGEYYQNLYTLKELRQESIFSPFSVLFIAENENQIALSDHYLFSIKHTEIFDLIDMRFDFFYKKRYNLASYYPQQENGTSFEDGSAHGIEFLLKYHDKLNGWISYSYSRSIKHNEEFTYYSQYDRTHNLKLKLDYPISDKWAITAFFTLSTGLPITPLAGKYVGLAEAEFENRQNSTDPFDWKILLGSKNSDRIKDYHRLDIGITGTIPWNQYIIRPYLQIMNVYNSPNPFFYDYSPYASDPLEHNSRGSFITPTLGISFEF